MCWWDVKPYSINQSYPGYRRAAQPPLLGNWVRIPPSLWGTANPAVGHHTAVASPQVWRMPAPTLYLVDNCMHFRHRLKAHLFGVRHVANICCRCHISIVLPAYRLSQQASNQRCPAPKVTASGWIHDLIPTNRKLYILTIPAPRHHEHAQDVPSQLQNIRTHSPIPIIPPGKKATCE